MKKIKTFTILFLAIIAMISCSKETTPNKEKERKINTSELPQIVQSNILKSYAGAVLMEADEITLPNNSITYDVEIEYNSKTIEVMYDSQGTFLGEEVDDEDEGENEDEEEDDKN